MSGTSRSIYDKRGTGESGGAYTQDFSVLADDAVAAMREARRLAGNRAGRVGYQGGSQGGWVAPLAVSRAPVDFVVVSFGLAVSPIEEDQQEVELEMRLAGHGPDAIARAREVARAAEAVFMSGFTDGIARFDALRARYRNEPWYKDLRGNMTRLILPFSAKDLREKGPAYRFGTPWHHDSVPVLRAVQAPQLWLLGEDDLEAPSADTAARIRLLATQGRPITLAMFPHAEHGMTEYEGSRFDARVSTRYNVPSWLSDAAGTVGKIGLDLGAAYVRPYLLGAGITSEMLTTQVPSAERGTLPNSHLDSTNNSLFSQAPTQPWQYPRYTNLYCRG